MPTSPSSHTTEPSGAAQSPPPPPMTRDAGHWLEIITAVILSLATVATAWTGYQATRWSGVMATAFNQAAAGRVESAKYMTEGQLAVAIDVGLFSDWVRDYGNGDVALADFLYERFPDRLRVATDAWIATDPLTNPNAPATPFAMPEYRVAELEKVDELTAQAEATFEEAKVANQRGDNYVLTTVLFASVLFFVAIAGRFKTWRIKVVLVALGAVMFIANVGVVLSFPIH